MHCGIFMQRPNGRVTWETGYQYDPNETYVDQNDNTVYYSEPYFYRDAAYAQKLYGGTVYINRNGGASWLDDYEYDPNAEYYRDQNGNRAYYNNG